MSIYYLVSSLPSFSFGDKPFYSSELFVGFCSDWIDSSKQNELKELSLTPLYNYSGKSSFIRKWYDHIGALSNTLTAARSKALGRTQPLQPIETYSLYSDVEKAVQEALIADNPLEKEKKIDRLKWYIVDMLESNHQFDFDKLCAYKLKIMLCEKWVNRREPEGVKNLDDALALLYTPSDEKKNKNSNN